MSNDRKLARPRCHRFFLRAACLAMPVLIGCTPVNMGFIPVLNTALPPPNDISYDRVSPSIARFDGVGVPGSLLGKCASSTGVVLVPQKDCVAPPTVDDALRPDLVHSGFRYYSRILTVDANAGVSIGVSGGGTTVKASSFALVLEWARWRTQYIDHVTTAPIVGAVDVGVGVRIVFAVTIRNATADMKANFGFGSLAAALALNRADISIAIDPIGTPTNFLDKDKLSLASVKSVEDYAKFVNTYYAAVRELSSAYGAYVESTLPAGPAPAGGGNRVPAQQPIATDEAKPKDAQRVTDVSPLTDPAAAFKPAILAYYILNLPADFAFDATAANAGYLAGARAVAEGVSCLAGSTGSHSASYVKGYLNAYRALSNAKVCNDSKPDSTMVDAAKSQLAGLPIDWRR